jgi:predicted MFS family arabinose efflux permease
MTKPLSDQTRPTKTFPASMRDAPADPAQRPGISPGLTFLLAIACGMIVANIYYAQPLVGPIHTAIGLSTQAAGFIVTLTQMGYCLGLLFIVPLGDLYETRRLVVTALGAAVLALIGAGAANSAPTFLLAAFVIGLASVAAQIIVPYAAHLAPEASRGRVVGNVMSGLLLGIMLARPIASFVADLFGWHAIFFFSAAAIALLAIVLRLVLPQRRPSPVLSYGALLASMWGLLRRTPVLRRRAFYHACLFAAFSLFWTTVPLVLAAPGIGLSQKGIALFALVGAAGAIAAPFAGTMADKGWSRPLTGFAILAAAASFFISRIGDETGMVGLVALIAAALVLDFCVSANLVMGQRAIFSLGAEIRSRLNGLYMTLFFAGGAAGSALGAYAYAEDGWALTAWLGVALPLAAFLYYLSEWRAPKA